MTDRLKSTTALSILNTVEPLLTDTSLIRTVHLVPEKCPYILCKNNLYNTDNGHEISAPERKFIQTEPLYYGVILAGYSPQDILNMDETGKFYRALTNKSLSEAAKQCRGGKQSKERIKCAFFVNAAGGKEKPIVIGKSANPRCFKGIKDLSNLPCTYFHQKKAWMDFDILDQVLTKLNRRCQRESRSVLLLLDNAPCHPYDMKGKYPNIKCVFFLPNCTSRLQPLDLGIIQSFKLKYAKLMLTHVVSLIDDCETAGDVCKTVNVLQAIRWIGQAWEAVEPSTIIKCFANAGVLDKERNVVEAVESPNDEDPFADLEE